MPPTPQPTTPTALIIVVCESVPTSVSGKAQPPAGRLLLTHAVEQMFEIDLMDNADTRRHDAEGVERLHSPFHELIALAVTFELAAHVLLQGLWRTVMVDLYRMVDDQVDRHQRLDAPWIEPACLRHMPHRRQIAKQGHAGEILQHDTRDDQGNLLAARRPRPPLGKFEDVPLADPLSITVAQQRFENDAQGHRQASDSCRCRQPPGPAGNRTAPPADPGGVKRERVLNGEGSMPDLQTVAHGSRN
jgi:hypothetical protein